MKSNIEFELVKEQLTYLIDMKQYLADLRQRRAIRAAIELHEDKKKMSESPTLGREAV